MSFFDVIIVLHILCICGEFIEQLLPVERGYVIPPSSTSKLFFTLLYAVYSTDILGSLSLTARVCFLI